MKYRKNIDNRMNVIENLSDNTENFIGKLNKKMVWLSFSWATNLFY